MNRHQVPGKAESYWIATTPETGYSRLQQGLTVDAAIIGGGFAGIASAFFLKEAGLKVAVLEGSRIVTGVTGNTTAKVTSLHGPKYKRITQTYGEQKAKQYADSNQAAIDKIESLVKERNIDCDFSRLPFFLYAQTDEAVKRIEEEIDAAEKLGLPVSFSKEIPLPISNKGAIRIENQAQFHPRKFLLALASDITRDDSYVFENTRVTDIEYGETCTLFSDKGRIHAKNVVVATNFPIFDKEGLYFARLKPSMSYALAVRLGSVFPKGMFFGADEKAYGWRTQPDNNGDVVIVSGASHTPGHEDDTTKFYRELQTSLKEVYPDASIEYSWSTQDNIPYDGVPYIGKLSPLRDNVYVATGFSQWGMTMSIVAGAVLTDLIRGRENPWMEVYDPSRFTPDTESAKKLISQNTHNIKKFVEERFSGKPAITDVGLGEGKVIGHQGKKTAVYKDEQGNTFKLSAICTHMGCVVHWNNAEQTWDCPCHGSRYSSKGQVIHAPAVKGLAE